MSGSTIIKPPLGRRLDYTHPLSKGLVGAWLMNEGAGGKVADLSGNKNDGVFVNSPTWGAGKFGSGIETVYASSQKINCGANIPLRLTGAFAYSMWFRVLDWAGGSTWGLIGGDALGAGDAQIGIAIGGFATNMYCQYYQDATVSQAILTHAVSGLEGNGRHHLVYTYDGGSDVMRVYVDGKKIGQAVTAVGPANWDGTDGNFYILGSQSRYIEGTHDNYMVWERGLSASEVASLYAKPFQMFRQSIIVPFSGGISLKNYTRGDVAALPADDTDLENAFSDSDYDDVETDNAVRVSQSATGEYSAFLFKDKNTSQQQINVTWNGQTDRAPSDSTVYLQIYNRDTTSWETIDSDDATGADTDFDLEGEVSADLGDYFDANFEIACRVYQEAV